MWGKVWSRMFKDMNWHRMCSERKITPGIVGFDLHLTAEGDTQTDKLIALLFPGLCQLLDKLPPREKLLHSLHPYIEKKKDELFFPKWKLTLNISSMHGGNRVMISRPHLLFSLSDSLHESLKTALLHHDDNAKIWDVGRGLVGGLCNRQQTPRTLGDVKDVFSVLLQGVNGEIRYHRFQRPGCPKVREILAEYNGCIIGPWRFEKCTQTVSNLN